MPITRISGVRIVEDYPLSLSDLNAIEVAENSHFWFKARNTFILKYLEEVLSLPKGSKLLEIGCGGGLVSRHLKEAGFTVYGVDTSAAQLQRAEAKDPEIKLFQGNLEELPPSLNGFFDAILFFDVIEHIADPTRLLEAGLRYCKDDANVVVTVPASQKLFSGFDILSGHKKRYNAGEVSDIFRKVGLLDILEFSMFSLIYPLLLISRSSKGKIALKDLSSYVKAPPKPINLFMQVICHLESRFLYPQSLLPGSSIIASARCKKRFVDR